MGMRSKRGRLECFFAETVGWRAPPSVGDDVRGMKGLGSARWSLMKKPPSEPSFVETCRVVFVEEGGSRAGAEEEKRRGARD